jgi:hypothetical protein
MKIALSIPGYGQVNPGNVPDGGAAANIVWTLIDLVIVFSVLLAIFFILLGGWNMITSEGQKEKMANARKEIGFALLGLILIFLSFAFVNLIGSFAGVNLLKLPF